MDYLLESVPMVYGVNSLYFDENGLGKNILSVQFIEENDSINHYLEKIKMLN